MSQPAEFPELEPSWPTNGDLIVSNLSAWYSRDEKRILSGISFSVKSGERIGVGKYTP